MLIEPVWRKVSKAITGFSLAALLSGCLLSPGAFVSDLNIQKDGHFTFTYRGEIYLMPLSKMAAGEHADFNESPCYDDNGNDRACSASELEIQRSEWADGRDSDNPGDRAQEAAFKTLMGGLDPANPQAAEELATRLRRQEGWNAVEYMGDGLFMVDYAITSQLTHDYIFPVFESFPMANAFVIANRREGGVIRIEAPGFSAQGASSNPMAGMMKSAAAGKSEDTQEDAPTIPELNGRFTIHTDAMILANNTDEGPQNTISGQLLDWTINAQTASQPMALIRLGD